MNRLIRIAATLLPPYLRDRYREQWLADLRDAPEAGIRPSEIIVGAYVFGATINRASPEISGMPLETFALRKARWGVAHLTSAFILAFAFYSHAGSFFSTLSGSEGLVVALLNGLSIAVAGGMVVAFVLGIAHLVSAIVRTRNRLAQVSLLLLLAGAGTAVVGWMGSMNLSLVLLGVVLILASGGCAIAVLTATRFTPAPTRTIQSVRRLRTGILGTAAILVIVALGTVDLLVWNPLAMVPDGSLDEIYAGIGAGLVSDVVFIVVWAVLWTLLASVPTLLALPRATVVTKLFSAHTIVVTTLLIVGVAIFFKFWAGFGLGMDIADAFAVSGGAASITAGILDLIGTLALVSAVFLTVPPRRLSTAPAVPVPVVV